MTALSPILPSKFCLAALVCCLLGLLPIRAHCDETATNPESEPEKIRDNLFLLEEAYNQEPGVIQHIQSFALSPGSGSWNYIFTEEWPVGTDRHQLSLTVPALDQGKLAPLEIGDLLLNYRLQVIGKGGAGRLAMAPRLSVAFPTGKYQTSSDRGGTGLQFNLPVSLEIGDQLVTHLNAGFTITPRAKAHSGFSETVLDTNTGVALVWLPFTWANPLVEFVHLTTQQIQDDRALSRSSIAVINPGIRFAINCKSGLQIVPGISAPIQFDGVGSQTSILFYLSLEHPIRRP